MWNGGGDRARPLRLAWNCATSPHRLFTRFLAMVGRDSKTASARETYRRSLTSRHFPALSHRRNGWMLPPSASRREKASLGACCAICCCACVLRLRVELMGASPKAIQRPRTGKNWRASSNAGFRSKFTSRDTIRPRMSASPSSTSRTARTTTS